MNSAERVGCGQAGTEKESSAATWAMKQARDTDMLCLGLRTDASEPQYTGVILTLMKVHALEIT